MPVAAYGDIYVSSIRRADSPRKINEAENRPRSSEISNYFSLFGYLRDGSAKTPGRKSKIFQKSFRSTTFKYVRSYMTSSMSQKIQKR